VQHIDGMLLRNPSSRPWEESVARFACGGATLGLGIGLVEAALLFFLPRFSGLLRPDVDPVIWFVAPLIDMVSGALLGSVFGSVGWLFATRGPRWRNLVVSAGIAVAGAYLGFLLDWFRIGAGSIFPRRPGAVLVVECFLISFAAAFLIRIFSRPRVNAAGEPGIPFRRLAKFNLIAACVFVCAVASYVIWRPYLEGTDARQHETGAIQHDPRPNIIFIVADTVRADHLSCYGYSRRTTPAIDRIASRGTLFENAYAPTSWTLASLASILTGLLPHQHGADWMIPLNNTPWTLARVLSSEGYETAGFSSNPFYGLGAWGLSRGFGIYIDDSYSLRHNLAATFVGQSVLEFLYDRLVRYNQFAQRSAADVNQDILRWWRHRPSDRPFFVFINYMDAHRPYLPPSPYDRRFGEIPHPLLSRLMEPLKDGRPSTAYTRREREQMIDGYDNSLAYLDSQIGKLLQAVAANNNPRGTIIVFTSDHGEGFGEHGTYDHGWNLYSNVLHVPLIIEGPGIPAGLRIARVVASRQLFSTVLSLAMPQNPEAGRRSRASCPARTLTTPAPLGGESGPRPALSSPSARRVRGSRRTLFSSIMRETTLARFWSPKSSLNASKNAVVSELGADNSAHLQTSSLSLVKMQWQYIQDSNGRSELYDLRSDPLENHDLADEADFQPIADSLEASLKAQIAYSVLPWYGPAYLGAFRRGGAGLLEQVSDQKIHPPVSVLPIGVTQEYFSHNPPSQPLRPSRTEEDLLRSLPYH
jgi:arylsulfatase A-like enzyme